jgi:hypothetical protein
MGVQIYNLLACSFTVEFWRDAGFMMKLETWILEIIFNVKLEIVTISSTLNAEGREVQNSFTIDGVEGGDCIP